MVGYNEKIVSGFYTIIFLKLSIVNIGKSN